MTAAHLHLISVHLPIVLCPLALVLFGCARLRAGTPSARIARWLLVAAAVVGIPAYLSGPAAFEAMESELAPLRELVEWHALLGRASLVTLVLLALAAVQAMLLERQEGRIPTWLHRVVVAGSALLTYLLAWTGHVGGRIRHPEIGEVFSRFFR